jgi:hypothetical protein
VIRRDSRGTYTPNKQNHSPSERSRHSCDRSLIYAGLPSWSLPCSIPSEWTHREQQSTFTHTALEFSRRIPDNVFSLTSCVLQVRQRWPLCRYASSSPTLAVGAAVGPVWQVLLKDGPSHVDSLCCLAAAIVPLCLVFMRLTRACVEVCSSSERLCYNCTFNSLHSVDEP